MYLLSVDQLSLRRGDRVLAEGLSLDLAPGELVHLRGANGVGKTSLLETLAGLRRTVQGVIHGPAAELPPHWLGHRNGLNLNLSPLENLEWWCGLNGAAASAAEPALARLGLAPRTRHRPCRSLSAGQKRRTALARLAVQQRPLWLLDEPLDGLDAAGLRLFAELMSAHLAQGGGAIVTSHQPLPEGLRARDWVLGA